ncbi:hypothetical protein EYE40_02355 [Glaciihabitans arcticus]|uniref:Uncharacterized protein n=1 Tax=Glaciihabitans arcticus TaxID=2668039 RepID=A0A4V2JEP9_9MICO|nr:hypothetical protein [Glaciihabitans arcticus]TBN56329.1 hypothetical protein EYE40_02355 [Glaciihabitans arcticus]
MSLYAAPEFPPAEPLPPIPVGKRPLWPVVTAVLVVALIVASSITAFMQRDNIRDLITVWNYETPAEIDAYIERATMTDRAAFLFKASEPQITSSTTLNEACSSHEEGVGVLGCYIPSIRSILLFDVTDDRLDGIEEVVASHEVLHAAWARMSQDDRDAVAPLLEEAAASMSDDEDFTTRMAVYATLEPGQKLNELHSIIGTEVAGIPAALETYYEEYFSDRAALVALHLKSHAVFVDIQERSDALIAELTELREGIEADVVDYEAGYDSLNRDIEGFNRRADSGDFGSAGQFNAERNAIIARQAALDKNFASIKAREKIYDKKRVELEALNAQAAELNEGLNIEPRTDTDVE